MLFHPWRCPGNDNLYAHWEDLADWLNRFVSVLLVLILGVCSMAYVYILRPITCQIPSSMDGLTQDHLHETCWAYFLSDRELFKGLWTAPRNVMLSVLGFSIPYMLCQHFAEKLIDSVVQLLMKRLDKALDKFESGSAPVDRVTTEMARYVIELITTDSNVTTAAPMSSDDQAVPKTRFVRLTYTTRLFRSKMRVGIPWMLFIVKALYLTNVLAQWMYTGYKPLISMPRSDGSNYSLTYSYSIFPHSGQCRLGHHPEVAVQCALSGNMFLHQTYETFNTWLGFLLIITAVAFVLWLVRMIWTTCCRRRLRWTKNRLLRARSCVLLRFDDNNDGNPCLHYHDRQSTCDASAPVAACVRKGTEQELSEIDKFSQLIAQTDAVVLLELVEYRAGAAVADQIWQKSWRMYTIQLNKIRGMMGGHKSNEASRIQDFLIDDTDATVT